MPWVKGKSGNPSGKPKGTLSKTTRDVREAIAQMAQDRAGDVGRWLDEVEEPARRLELYARLIEYHIPKLSSVTLNLQDQRTDDLVAELARRAPTTSDGT